MYSRRESRERRRGYTVPPGYDGSRFKRHSADSESELVEDFEFASENTAPVTETEAEESAVSEEASAEVEERGIAAVLRSLGYRDGASRDDLLLLCLIFLLATDRETVGAGEAAGLLSLLLGIR